MIKKHYVSWQDVNNQVAGIIQQLAVDDWKPEVIVGIARGGLYPAMLLSNYFNVPLEVIKCQLRDGDTILYSTDSLKLTDKRVLIVDDINDSGATLFKTCEHLVGLWQLELKVAVLFDNEASEFQDVEYAAITINKAEEDIWYDFPWESWWKR